jgi:hypothetical protein
VVVGASRVSGGLKSTVSPLNREHANQDNNPTNYKHGFRPFPFGSGFSDQNDEWWAERWRWDTMDRPIDVGGVMPSKPTCFCPNCDALYQLVKLEAGPETITDRKFPCRACGAPLDAHDSEFVLKYFLLRTAGRKQSWQKRSLSV